MTHTHTHVVALLCFLILRMTTASCDIIGNDSDDACSHDVLPAVDDSLLQTSLIVHKQHWAQISKPWDHHLYVVGTRHKAGDNLLSNIMSRAFGILSATCGCSETYDQALPLDCSLPDWNDLYEDLCFCAPHVNCSIHFNGVFTGEDLLHDREMAGKRGMRAVHIIRDPLQMVASAYCFHHSGQELGTLYAPANITLLNVTEGVPLVAKYMLQIMSQMVDSYLVSDTRDTYIIWYENMTRSSSDFDHKVAEMIDFLFENIISPAQKQQIQIEARLEDPSRPNVLHSGHVSDEECKVRAGEAFKYIPEDLYSQYQQYRAVLGYI